jgi:Putative Actinobacterial Holin-X, holin superfamily III
MFNDNPTFNDNNEHTVGTAVGTQFNPPSPSANFHSSDEKTLGQLFVAMSEDLSTLVHKELELALAELGEKVNQATSSIVKLVMGAILLHLGASALLATAVLALGTIMPYWLAALIVGALVLLIGLILVQTGRANLRNLSFVPAKSLSSLRNDTQMVKEKIQ